MSSGRTHHTSQTPGNSSSAPGSSSRRRRRPQPPVLSGVGSSYEDKDNDFVCPICFDMIEEAHMTKCGHSFCHKCIKSCLEQNNRCPKCNLTLDKPDQIFPNFLLDELIQKQRQKLADHKKRKTHHNGFGGDMLDVIEHDMLDLGHVNYLLDYLGDKKMQLEGDNQLAQHQVLKEFLLQIRAKKKEALDQLTMELSLIDNDLQKVDNKLAEHKARYPTSYPIPSPALVNGIETSMSSTMPQSTISLVSASALSTSTGQDGFNGSRTAGRQWLQKTMASRRKKVNQHFDDLEQCYFSVRHRHLDQIQQTQNSAASGPSATTNTNSSTPSFTIKKEPGLLGDNMAEVEVDPLDEFTESLTKFTKYTSFRPLATLNYASDIYNNSSIVSSIEFDRDCDFFAIAGVTKKIKVFEYGTVIRDAVDMHYPHTEMVCNSKISSIIWSSYHKSMLASSDYEGTVTLWDAFTGVKSRIFQEHEKRCWSVDFNRMDPKLLASGSDDSKVKLWNTNTEHSIACLEAKANVCCVKFNPESRFHLAFGSADHCVHYYDLRNLKQPISVFKGHRKAVSYTKFVSPTEIVSASTDSQLKLWGINKQHCVRTYKGHTNEKNFVGLASDGDYVACGSENNSLYIYYKGLSKQLLTFKFDTVRSVLDKEKRDEDTNEFVSAVCWRPGSSVVVAANSQGTIKVLELV